MAKIVVFALLCGLAFILWRHWAKRRRQAFIEQYPYARFLEARLALRHPQLTAAQRVDVLAALADYFQLCRLAGRRMVAMPSQVVDDAWHEFILFTRQYDKFCRGAFGRFLHHTPAEAMAAPTQASAALRRAWRLACAQEGINPRTPERLPRLFALDAALLIAGGFVYQLDCLASARAGNGTAHCASHIGCGGSSGGCSGDSGSFDSFGSGDSSSDSGSDGGGGCGGD